MLSLLVEVVSRSIQGETAGLQRLVSRWITRPAGLRRLGSVFAGVAVGCCVAGWALAQAGSSPALVADPPGPSADATSTPTDAAFVRARLVAAVRLYDRAFRVEPTGQYLDAIDLQADTQGFGPSSIAATGIGLISLAMADALGIDPRGAEKAETTLSNLLNADPRMGFLVDRSEHGWFVQYIDPRTGAATADHKGKYSTVDTALLAVGALMAGRYFEGKDGPAAARVAALSRQLLGSVSWASAIRDPEAGRLHALFIGKEEAPFPTYWGELFDEYVLIPCLGRYAEGASERHGPSSTFWERHVADVGAMPTKRSGSRRVLSHTKNDYVSHFTHQFAFYLCGDLGRDPAFQHALSELRAADREWFASRAPRYPERWWGLGAGSALIRSDSDRAADPGRAAATELYVASTLETVDEGVISPPIMAGFLMLDALEAERRPGAPFRSRTLADLRAIYDRGECRYRYADQDVLWRCSAFDPFAKVRFMQGIDFSTYMLGLSTLVPEIGLGFFRSFAP